MKSSLSNFSKLTLPCLLALTLALLLGLTLPVQAEDFDLTSSCDVSSLITAINSANANAEADTITLAEDCVYSLTAIEESDPDGYGPVGLPTITTTITIIGNGATIQRSSGTFRLFYVADSGDLTLDGLNLSNGLAQGGNGGRGRGAGGGGAGMGGAVFNRGTLTIQNSTLSGNEAIGGDGAVNNTNTSGAGGGGMGGNGNDGSGVNSRDGGGVNGGDGGVGNDPGGEGGGGSGGKWNTSNERGGNGGFGGGGGGASENQHCCGNPSLNNGGNGGFGGGGGGDGDGSSTQFDPGTGGFGADNGNGDDGGDGAGLGGAIFNYSGNATLLNTTFYNNTAAQISGHDGYGGGVFNYRGTVTVTHVTFANNTAVGGGIYNYGSGGTATLIANSTIFADTAGGEADCTNDSGTVTDSNNLIETNDGCGTPSVTSDPALETLADNGGGTQTMALPDGSAAIDLIANGVDGCGTTITTDQRGLARPQNGSCDIGAYEFLAATIEMEGNSQTITSGDNTPSTDDDTDFGSSGKFSPISHTFTIWNNGGENLILSGSPAVILGDGTHFSVTQPDTTTIRFDESVTFTVTFVPQSLGSFSALLVILSNDPAQGAFTFYVGGEGWAKVESVFPLENSLNVTATSQISLTYDSDIAASSVSTRTVTVRGEQTGIYPGTYSFPDPDTILIDPTAQFKAGEVVRVVASAQVESTDAITASPYQWQFTATSQDGTGQGDVWQKQTLDGNFNGAFGVYAADMDGDGDMDVLGTADNAHDIAWWENDGNQNFTKYTIANNFQGARGLYATDVDGDGDMDVLGTAFDDNEIAWWENDGNQNFAEHTIKSNFSNASSVYAADVDSDGDMDLLGTASGAKDITWWENDGNQNFTEHTIKGNFDEANSVYAADVDGDGDLDVLGTALTDDDITWWENDGSQTFTEQTIDGDFDGAYSVYAADIDGDGDTDVLGTAVIADDITWWENDGNQNFTEYIIKDNFNGTYSVYAADVDGDGDMDVLGAANGADDITWWENDGNQNFTEQTIDGDFDGAYSVYAADMDDDGDLDVLGTALTADEVTIWYNTAPEIAVLGNGTEIISGDTTPSSADDADFGSLLLGETLTHTFTISSNGVGYGDDLLLSGSPIITVSNGAAFTVTQPISTTLAPGKSTTFSLTFAPPSEGNFTDTITIANNDPNENPYTFVISGTGLCPGSPIYVNQNATGNNIGNSWTDAFTDLQDGLTLAQTCALTEIWVAAGVYTPGSSQSDTFTLTTGVALYGGFAATETLRTERDWTANLTVLSGDIGGDDITDTNGIVTDTTNISGSNSYQVVYADGTSGTVITETTVLDGFAITAGQAFSLFPQNLGGGFYCDGSGSECSPSLSNITFSGNSAGSGGGMYNNGSSAGTSSPSLSNVTFFANSATSGGGAIGNSATAGGVTSPSLTDVAFIGNSADDGGAIFNWAYQGGSVSSPSLSNVIFSGNSADRGGAIYNRGSTEGSVSSPSLTNVTISNNSANQGGAFYSASASTGLSSPNLSNVIVWGNTATVNGSQFYNDGGTPVLNYTLIQSDIDAIYNENGGSVTDGSGNINADPLFVDALGMDGITGTLDDDLRLSDGSPAVDAGDNSATALSTDLDSNARFYDDTGVVDTGQGTSPLIDLGAYEKQTNTPELTVIGQGQDISSGDTSPSTLDDTDFGTVDFGATLTHTFTISNSGDVAIILTGSPAITLSNGTVFSITQPASTTLGVGENTTFSLTFSPQSLGTFTDTVTIINNDPDENPYTFVISGTGSEPIPEIDVLGNGQSIANGDVTPSVSDDTDFGDTAVTNSITHTFTISNSGTADLTLNGTLAITLAVGTHFSVTSQPSSPVASGDSTTFQIMFAPTATGSFTDTVTIANDDGDENPYTFVISGTGTMVDYFTLAVALDGTGSGGVVSDPSGIDCAVGSEIACSDSFVDDTVVTLTATADAGSTFSGWDGACTGTAVCVVTMDEARNVTATFSSDDVEHLIFLPMVINNDVNAPDWVVDE